MWRSNGGVINAMELFHGTRNTDPSLIYKGAEGFDIRLSRSGMWGQGNYFAAHASYSHGYAYCLPNGCKQMFLVRVLTRLEGPASLDTPDPRALRGVWLARGSGVSRLAGGVDR